MVAVTIDIDDGAAEKYEHVVNSLYPGGKLPDGWLVHFAGPTKPAGVS